MMLRKILVGAMCLCLAVAIAPVFAANGDNLRTIIADRTGTDCVTTGPSGSHSSVGVGVAYNGVNLLLSCYSDDTVTAVSPADGSQVMVHHITGASALGALAWDSTNTQLWACSGFDTVGIVDLTANTFTPKFTTTSVIFGDGSPGSGCFDGLAYDGMDNTIWASGDANDRLNHYSTTGAPISATNGMTGKLGGCGNSGIAVGGTNLYLANDVVARKSTRPTRA